MVHADETGWRENGQNGYARLFATPAGERYVEYQRSRAGAVANSVLGETCCGVVVSDVSGGSNDTPGGRHQRCWVQPRRDAQALGEAHADDLSVAGLETRVWVAALKTRWTRRCRWCSGGSSGSNSTFGRWGRSSSMPGLIPVVRWRGDSGIFSTNC